MSLRYLVEAVKSLPYRPEWTEPDSGDGYTRLSVPLEIDGVTEAGLTFDCGTYEYHPDEHVTLELSVLGKSGRRRIRLMRLDWRSLKGGHSNDRRRCSGPWSGRRVPETHLHSFDLNWIEADQRMKKGKLPCAEPIPEPLQSLAELIDFAGRCFRINNIDIVPPPNWVYDLFRS